MGNITIVESALAYARFSRSLLCNFFYDDDDDARLNYSCNGSEHLRGLLQLGPPEVFLPITRRVQNKTIGVVGAFGPMTNLTTLSGN